MHFCAKTCFLVILVGYRPRIFAKKYVFLAILVGYRPCIFAQNRAFLVILVGYRPCIFAQNRAFFVIMVGYIIGHAFLRKNVLFWSFWCTMGNTFFLKTFF